MLSSSPVFGSLLSSYAAAHDSQTRRSSLSGTGDDLLYTTKTNPPLSREPSLVGIKLLTPSATPNGKSSNGSSSALTSALSLAKLPLPATISRVPLSEKKLKPNLLNAHVMPPPHHHQHHHHHHHNHARRTYSMNPFRQQDEVELVSKRTHNRRRWSHVFAQGEEEFKRHASINWRSLCQPAILPLTTDFFPSEAELRDDYLFSHYTVSLDALDRTRYSTHTELMNELILQRLSQDLQIVPAEILLSKRRFNAVESAEFENGTRFILSMGHRITMLRYNEKEDVVEVTQYLAHFARNDQDIRNAYEYRYYIFNKTQRNFVEGRQRFSKYAAEFPWNSLDNLICGDPQKTLTEGTRFRRILFAILPPTTATAQANADYIDKFNKLIEYISNRCVEKFTVEVQRDDDESFLFQSSAWAAVAGKGGQISQPKKLMKRATTRPTRNAILPLNERKKKNNRFEWAVISLNATFDPKRVFRISIHWLVASSPRVESEVKGLHRRCAQFGLKMQQFPEYSISSDLFIHAFLAPPLIILEEGGEFVENALLRDQGFVDDGFRNTDYDIPGLEGFEFAQRSKHSPKREPARQLIHHTGFFFLRIMKDIRLRTVIFYLENRSEPAIVNNHHNFAKFKGLVETLLIRFLEERKEKLRELAENTLMMECDERRDKVSDLETLIAEKGNEVRQLKAAKASQDDIATKVAELLELKKRAEASIGGGGGAGAEGVAGVLDNLVTSNEGVLRFTEDKMMN